MHSLHFTKVTFPIPGIVFSKGIFLIKFTLQNLRHSTLNVYEMVLNYIFK